MSENTKLDYASENRDKPFRNAQRKSSHRLAVNVPLSTPHGLAGTLVYIDKGEDGWIAKVRWGTEGNGAWVELPARWVK